MITTEAVSLNEKYELSSTLCVSALLSLKGEAGVQPPAFLSFRSTKVFLGLDWFPIENVPG